MVVTVQVGRYYIVLSVSQYACTKLAYDSLPRERVLTLHLILGGLLHDLLDLVIACTFLNAAGEVNNRDVGSWDTHGHSCKLAVERRNDLADGFGRTSAAGDDVLGSGAASSPVLCGRPVNSLLSGGVGMDGRHETFDDGEVVVHDLGKGCETVGCARGVGDDISLAVVGLLVDTHDVHGRIG